MKQIRGKEKGKRQYIFRHKSECSSKHNNMVSAFITKYGTIVNIKYEYQQKIMFTVISKHSFSFDMGKINACCYEQTGIIEL